MKRPLLAVVLVLALTVAVRAALADDQPGHPMFTHGVASGDVTPNSAILWTRVDRQTSVKVEVWNNPSLTGQKAFESTESQTSSGNDFTVKIDATGLTPNTTYYYRFRHGDEAGDSVSPVGTFKTAPDPSASANVKFTFTGDSDGTRVSGNPAFNNFEVLNAARLENPDFFVYLGDTIYSDSSFRSSPATTLDEYQAAYRENRTYPNLTDLLKATSTYAQQDDHEVFNDYDGQTVDPNRYAAGIGAFLDYMPLRESGLLNDPTCAGAPLFRAFHWGTKADVIIPDERSCRSGDVAIACAGDLAPTLPTPFRLAFGLPASPPAGCLAAINDPTRTVLGPVQKQAFKNALLNSTAKFKFVINEYPIQQFWALPYDRWEGYGAERNEILNFIHDPDNNPSTNDSINNVVFLTTDIHATIVNEVFRDRFENGFAAPPTTIAQEVVTGPIATFTFQQEIINAFGPIVGPVRVAQFQAALSLAGVDCRNLNQDSYGVVDVDGALGTATVTSKDQNGLPVVNQAPPSATCTKTFGP
jgi:alkaline phosphatase D